MYKPSYNEATRPLSPKSEQLEIILWFLLSPELCNVSLSYFFDDLDRLFNPDYTPTVQDILHCRFRTTGIREMAFRLKEVEMLMVDVGGQRSERRKWIHCFQDVTAILFIVSLSGYDQCLVEDRGAVRWCLLRTSLPRLTNFQNQMQDALTIWDSICHSQWFEKTSIVSNIRH
jgi:guanine nucleotide-binding protein subunit alpha